MPSEHMAVTKVPDATPGIVTLGQMASKGWNGSPSFQPWKTC
jgi:hypothetical protein